MAGVLDCMHYCCDIAGATAADSDSSSRLHSLIESNNSVGGCFGARAPRAELPKPDTKNQYTIACGSPCSAMYVALAAA